ncbi:RNA polymerase I specific transcription initiation factor RRN3 family protein [Coccidioides posadasii C735 delta SOWgp]|uniref:RNA polymerase I specific transcription initiation factor RRN3 family protein n=1 Tax=Coccidioides posadasii (strain C735) TaxID=222929 RepID=C5P157_COCP7|nr:RNA polymerase I-specific transcription initiation factor RRN3 family protein [Coccidioides posadasii C735 delta SOWgp]EER29415.1 RNA polymerase I specific transcription initiation factor RRN3 family protein [Coccidioides posadasii C735 delta SOWgp]|eukprot:XP_003071560.1 RNA polymerase I-specific transcription initiation factor RRN3 family protein [Coccidioides posadasii C735 delta SOWgp]
MSRFHSSSRGDTPPSSAPSMSMPSKSILKVPMATAQKRKKIDMDLSSDVSTGSDSPGAAVPNKKRARVTFEMDTPGKGPGQQAVISGDVGAPAYEKSTALVREEVSRAIQRHLVGDSDAYDRVKEIFSVDPKALEVDGSPVYDLPTHTSLKNHLLGLLSNVSALDSACSGLVHAVLDSEWLGRDEAYVKLFVRFLGTLAAARGGYLTAVLRMLVNNLREVPFGTGRLPGYAVVRNAEIYDRVHFGIQHIIQLIPAGSVTLSPILSSGFPHDTDTAKAHIVFTRNLIKMIDYAPELRSDILALITEKLVKIDVQIQVDLDDFEDEDEEKLHNEITAEAFVLEDDNSDVESTISDEESTSAETQRFKALKENINKIDYMLDLLFEYYSGPFNYGTLDDKENNLDLLLAHFQNIILPTYRSRHSQFLLFHYSQSSPILVDRFAAACIQIILSKSHPSVLRQYAAAYLASFVARGAHVTSEVVRDVFDLLCTHLKNLITEYESNCRGPDLRRYATFYATAQAILYIFCFRWRDLTTAAQEGDIDIHVELDLDQVRFPPNISDVLHTAIHSKLNPLKICSPSIVREFARIAHHVGFMYVFPLLETNKRIRIFTFRSSMSMDSRFGQIERETRADNDLGPQLDAYFPFDPYNLPRSRRWLEGDYVEWRGVPGLRDDDDDDDTDGRYDEEDELDHCTETDEDAH